MLTPYYFLEEATTRKLKKRTFFCLPHADSSTVPPSCEWTRLIGHGIGPKTIDLYVDATAKEMVKKMYEAFPALNGVQFSYAKARRRQIAEEDIIDNSVSMTTLRVQQKLL